MKKGFRILKFKKDKPIFEIKDINKSFDGRPILKKISLKIFPGECVGILGPNGCGKTTLFSICIGEQSIDGGKIFLNNKPIEEIPIHLRSKEGLGYLPQEMSIFKGLSVEDNLLSIIETKEFDNHKRYQILEDLLVEFNITKIRSSLGITLSGGERRRVEIARCIASNPTHILLDEPFSGIDPIAIQDLKNLIGYLKQRKIGVLITDHNVKDTLDIVDRAYVLYDGKILLKGNPFEIKNDQKVKSVYLGKSFSV